MTGPASSFIRGMAHIFDFAGALTYFPIASTDEEAWESDRQAIASDWAAVGQDMQVAWDKVRVMHPEQSETRR